MNTNFDAVPWHWFYHFSKTPEPGSLCDPYRLDVGEAFVTNYSIFTWTLTNVLPPNQEFGIASSDVYYSGTNPDSCDVEYLSFTADARTYSTQIGAQVACNSSLGAFAMGTSFNWGRTWSTTTGNAWLSNTLQWDATNL